MTQTFEDKLAALSTSELLEQLRLMREMLPEYLAPIAETRRLTIWRILVQRGAVAP
jgi:hypothetical protein